MELLADYAKDIADPQVSHYIERQNRVCLFCTASVPCNSTGGQVCMQAMRNCISYVSQTRAEQDQYIRQLEEEGRGQEVYGKGMQLVTPTAVFVAKTANKQSGQKIFINVCTSDKASATAQPHHC